MEENERVLLLSLHDNITVLARNMAQLFKEMFQIRVIGADGRDVAAYTLWHLIAITQYQTKPVEFIVFQNIKDV